MEPAPADGRTAFIFAMPMELQPMVEKLALQEQEVGDATFHTGELAGRGVVATVTGMGTKLATAGTERLLDAMPVDRVVVVGITGALENETPIGTLVVPEVVVDSATGDEYRPAPLGDATPHGKMWTTDVLITQPEALSDLLGKGVVSLDMETAAIARTCEGRGIPWSVFRVISDRASDGSVDEEVFHLSNQDGTPVPGAAEAYFKKHPEKIEAMARLAEGARLAAESAVDEAIRACSSV
jgi:adenosylhomocysteine nucleosidase